MTFDSTIFVDYDDSLIGRNNSFYTDDFYSVTPGGINQQKALQVIRYALEDILEWDEKTILTKFDKYIIRIMNLEKVVRYIDYPVEVESGDPKYILACLYPGRLKLSEEKLVTETYKKVLREGADGEAKTQFPREYFGGGLGFRRFCICLKYLIENATKLKTIPEIYSFFDSPKGKKYLYDFRLKVPAEQFAISMPDVIHYITKDEDNSDLFYYRYLYDKELKRVKNETEEK